MFKLHLGKHSYFPILILTCSTALVSSENLRVPLYGSLSLQSYYLQKASVLKKQSDRTAITDLWGGFPVRKDTYLVVVDLKIINPTTTIPLSKSVFCPLPLIQELHDCDQLPVCLWQKSPTTLTIIANNRESFTEAMHKIKSQIPD